MPARDDAFEAWRRRALDVDIYETAIGPHVKASLRKKSREFVGACPLCGGGSTAKGKSRQADGFSVNPAKGVFNCRRGGVGGDVIAMVMHTCGVPFQAACEMITGEPPPAQGSVISEETRRKSEQLKAEAAERERRRQEDDNIYRQREIRTVRDIYNHAHPFAGSSAEIYAGVRGLVFPPVPSDRAAPIKCVEAMPYHVDKDTIVHRGPAMVAPIINAKREFQGLHFTYLDLDKPKGKIQIEHAAEPLDAKKSRGSKKGNFIALAGPVSPEFLVIGEAIEKTTAVYMALASTGRDLSSAAFWSACDLGNLTGPSAGSVVHPTLKSEKTGKPIKVGGPVPDLSVPAIEIPDSVTDLVLLGNSTSDPFSTKHAMARAAVRYSRPGRAVRIAWAPEGVDFDDLLRDAKGDETATAAALARIADIVDRATPDEPQPEVDPAAIAQAIRKFGLEQLNAGRADIAAAAVPDRLGRLSAIAEQLGQLVAAETLIESFVIASLEAAAADVGLLRDIGAKEIKAAISNALKAGKKQPRDLSDVRGAAIAALRAHQGQSRAPARDHLSSTPNPDEATPPNPPNAIAPSFSSPSPAPPAEGDEFESSQMGDWPCAAAAGGAGGGNDGDEDLGELNRRLAFYPLTDLGNAERFRDRQRGKLLFNTALATTSPGRQRGWLAWDARRWSSESGAERVMIAEHDTVRAIQQEADCIAESGDRDAIGAERGACDYVVEEKKDGTKTYYSDKIARWGRTSESAQKLGALSKRGAPYLSVGIGQLDADKMKINVNNGTLVVAKRDEGDFIQFQPHDPNDKITKVSPVDYDPVATAPTFQKFLERVQPKSEMRLFLQQWFGLSLTGDISAHKLVFLYGKGRNGKSVLVNAVSYVAGDYAQSVPI